MSTAPRVSAHSTRQRLLREAARLFAERGFPGTSIDELGAVAGIRGPGIYKHFSSKQAVLAALLCDVSDSLLAGARHVLANSSGAENALTELVYFHVDFALRQPDVIRVQDRDLASLTADVRARVRKVQRAYAQHWIDTLLVLRPSLNREEAEFRVHAVFGLINSTPHSLRPGADQAIARLALVDMALAALHA